MLACMLLGAAGLARASFPPMRCRASWVRSGMSQLTCGCFSSIGCLPLLAKPTCACHLPLRLALNHIFSLPLCVRRPIGASLHRIWRSRAVCQRRRRDVSPLAAHTSHLPALCFQRRQRLKGGTRGTAGSRRVRYCSWASAATGSWPVERPGAMLVHRGG